MTSNCSAMDLTNTTIIDLTLDETLMNSPPLLPLIKRDGRVENFHIEKITTRIQKFGLGHVDSAELCRRLVARLNPDMTTIELDNLAAETAMTMNTLHPNYALLAARIAVSSMHKGTKKVFSDVMEDLSTVDLPGINDKTMTIIRKNAQRLNSAIIYSRDFLYTYDELMSLKESHLLKIDGAVVERPQHMHMRVSVGIHGGNIDNVVETYNMLSGKHFTHSSRTGANAGTRRPQLSSEFIISTTADSIEGVYDTLKQCAMVSKAGGDIALDMHTVPVAGTQMANNMGTFNGLAHMVDQVVVAANHAAQSSTTVYVDVWHPELLEVLDKLTTSTESRTVSYGVCLSDFFMKRVENDGDWCLMCPHESPGLGESWGDEFESMYKRYEADGQYKSKLKARVISKAITSAQLATGMPFVLYKDAMNQKSNHKNLGTIKCSNATTELALCSARDEVAMSNSASIALDKLVENGLFDFKKLSEVVKVVTHNLNRLLDVDFYPTPEARSMSMRHRPIGIGVQGLADAFIRLRMPFESDAACKLNEQIFETIYYTALKTSVDIARRDGAYTTFGGSPVSKGVLQPDMWGVKTTDMWEWDKLRRKIERHGVRNSLLVALPPTTSIAAMLGGNNSVEPFTSYVSSVRGRNGLIDVVNRHLLTDLIDLGLWSDELKSELVANDGSVQNIACIPDDIKALYKTVWEMSPKKLIEQAAARGAFIDQSQSFSVYMVSPSTAQLSLMHQYGWKAGLKSCMFNLRTRTTGDKRAGNGKSNETTTA